jgi:hypothetical protein
VEVAKTTQMTRCMVRPCVARGFLDLAGAVLHQCIRSLIWSSLWLPTIMDISAPAISLPDRPRTGQTGHQYSHAPGRPILHLQVLRIGTVLTLPRERPTCALLGNLCRQQLGSDRRESFAVSFDRATSSFPTSIRTAKLAAETCCQAPSCPFGLVIQPFLQAAYPSLECHPIL